MAHVLELPAKTFYPDIGRNVLACGALTALFCGLARLYTPTGWITLILTACVYGALGAPLHVLLACDREQRAAVLRMRSAILTPNGHRSSQLWQPMQSAAVAPNAL